MKKSLYILLLFLLSFSSVADVDTRKIAIAYAKAVSIESIEKKVHGYDAVGELDFSQASALFGVDGNERSFVFVSFSSLEVNPETKGHFVVLEICGHEVGRMQHSFSGFTSNLRLEVENFESMKGDKTADYPGKCT